MVIGETEKPDHVRVLENIRLPVRLGADAFTLGRLSEATIQKAVEAFLFFRKAADAMGVSAIRAVATSAMRESANSDILIDRILRATGIEIEIISGEEEAELIHLAVSHAVDLGEKRAVLIDIGGGSVEVTISEDGQILSTESYNMGTVRLLNKLDQQNDTVSARRPFHLLVREYAEAARRRIERDIGSRKIHLCIGTGGNVEELGRLRSKLFERSDKAISLGELQDLIEKLSKLTVEQRIRKYELRPDRADVILPAAIVLQIIAREARVHQILIPKVGLKDGVLHQMARIMGGQKFLDRKQVWQSALGMGEKYQYDARHAHLTARLAAQLFDQTLPLHNLNDEERLLLEVASLLHDIGHFISTIDHEKHSYYVLKAHRLIGLNDRQQAIVANLAYYHRKHTPSLDEEHFRILSPKDRLTVLRLEALLRLADSMDVSHTGRVHSVSMQHTAQGWRLSLHGEGDFMLERWALQKRKALFEEVYGVKLEIR